MVDLLIRLQANLPNHQKLPQTRKFTLSVIPRQLFQAAAGSRRVLFDLSVQFYTLRREWLEGGPGARGFDRPARPQLSILRPSRRCGLDAFSVTQPRAARRRVNYAEAGRLDMGRDEAVIETIKA